MKISEYENRAGEMLKGKWGLVIGTTFVANLLGGVSTERFEVTELLEKSGVDLSNFNLSDRFLSQMSPEFIRVYSISLVIVAIILLIISFVFGGATKAGVCRFNKNLYYNTEPRFKDIFMHYNILGKALWTDVVMAFYIVMWSVFGMVPGAIVGCFAFVFSEMDLLSNFFIILSVIMIGIPGAIAFFAYSMTFYILDENPDMSAKEAVEASKNLMDGHKKEYFILYLNFFGFLVMASFIPFGIGMLFYNPYWLAAEYVFYDSIAHKVEDENEAKQEKELQEMVVFKS